MYERDLGPGDHMAEWVYTEISISELISDEVAFLRDAKNSGAGEITRIIQQRTAEKYRLPDEVQNSDSEQARLKAKTIEISQLKDQLATSLSGQTAKVDRPLHKRPRRTLLTIIAALCDQAGIDYKARGAAQRIKHATELVGAPVDDGTILTFLNEIPDALEIRMK